MFWTWIIKKGSKTRANDLSFVNKRTPFWKAFLLLSPALAIVISFIIVPFIFAVQNGFLFAPDKHDLSVLTFGTKNFTDIFADPNFIKAIKNSMGYAAFAVPTTIFASIIISASIAHISGKKTRGIIQTLFFLPYVTSAVAISIAFAYLFDFDRGLINVIIGKKIPWLTDPQGNSAMKAMIIYGIWRGLAFQILIFTTAMLTVDKTLYKAASIDGAGPIKQLFRITLPAINRTTNFIITMAIIGALKVFPLALFQNNPTDAMTYGGSTLMLYVYNLVKIGEPYMAGAASVLLVAISIVFSAIVKQGMNIIVKLCLKAGERNVSNKIKA
ncbi:carbohydrate ABC transporter permease [Mycoplasma marinum]|uniref:ABC transporter permease n=1 Tax=Mycoplasma marinum TaxID=1937190 RepID=A0A4R0XU37_9MOLU|nr:sugar ABC transporter permease [Mycoplasma marinum]TCG12048.1 ABC transporter permease [Mycoplasma marinum]